MVYDFVADVLSCMVHTVKLYNGGKTYLDEPSPSPKSSKDTAQGDN